MHVSLTVRSLSFLLSFNDFMYQIKGLALSVALDLCVSASRQVVGVRTANGALVKFWAARGEDGNDSDHQEITINIISDDRRAGE